jgi:hypothetical protein
MWESKRVRKILDISLDVFWGVMINGLAFLMIAQVYQDSTKEGLNNSSAFSALIFMASSALWTIKIIIQKHRRIPRSEIMKSLDSTETKNISAVNNNK